MDPTRRWEDVQVEENDAERLAAELEVPVAIGRVLAARGLTDPDEAGRFLRPRLSDLGDPLALPDAAPAVARIRAALERGEPITVFGDYDVDGITATALLARVLQRLGGCVSTFLPHRIEEGYGFTPAALTRCLAQSQPALIVTVDCGTDAVDTVAQAAARGIDVVVTDHHEVSAAPAPAAAVVNPKRGADEDLHRLAGVGVAFKLCHALVRDLHAHAAGNGALDLREFLGWVALGTVADVVPLLGENRILVRHGLDRLNRQPGAGLEALCKAAGVNGTLGSYHLGFVLGPRLNAAGRLGSADPALELLLCEEAGRARELADGLEAANRERRRIEEGIAGEAVRSIDARFDAGRTFGVVAAQTGWHVGAIGIVASRLCGRYHRPAVVIGFDDNGRGRGSCRGIEGVDLTAILEECADVLDGFGGHAMAAGLHVRRENLEAFRARFNAGCRRALEGRDLRPVLRVDGWIELGEADEAMWSALEMLSPAGVGNPTPLWGLRRVRPMGRPRVVGRDHLKMIVADGGGQMESIGFGLADRPVPDGPFDMLAQIRENHFRGRRSLQLHIKDFRSTEKH